MTNLAWPKQGCKSWLSHVATNLSFYYYVPQSVYEPNPFATAMMEVLWQRASNTNDDVCSRKFWDCFSDSIVSSLHLCCINVMHQACRSLPNWKSMGELLYNWISLLWPVQLHVWHLYHNLAIQTTDLPHYIVCKIKATQNSCLTTILWIWSLLHAAH